jgi:hypothetical protein
LPKTPIPLLLENFPVKTIKMNIHLVQAVQMRSIIAT